MIPLRHTVYLFLLCLLPAAAQNTAANGRAAADSSYFLQYPTLYFGTLCAGETLELSFTIRNISPRKITVAELTTLSPFSILTPIAPFVIRLAGRQTGDTLTIRGDAKDNSIGISATTLDFGDLPVNGSGIRTALIENTGGDTITVGSMSIVPGSAPFVILDPATPFSLVPGASITVRIRFTPPQPFRYGASASLHIDLPCPATKLITLVGNGLRGELAWSGSAIAFADAWCPGDLRRDSVRVTNIGTDTLTIFGAAIGGADPGDFSLVSAPPLPALLRTGESASFVVEFHPTAKGDRSGLLTITSNDAKVPVKEIPLTGRVNTAIFSTLPAGIAFGDVRVGAGSTLALEIRNPNPVPARVASIRFSPPDPDLQIAASLPAFIAPGDSIRVDVLFTPRGPGIYGGTVRIIFDQPGPDSIAVPVVGRGVQGAWTIDGAPFGDMIKCSSIVRRFILHNVGTADFTLDSARIEGSDTSAFSIRSAPRLPDLLPPTGFASFDILFAPVKPPNGPKSGSLVLFLHGADRDTVRYPLEGSRISPVAEGTQTDFGSVDLRVTSTRNVPIRNIDPYRIARIAFLDIQPPQFRYAGPAVFPLDSLASTGVPVRFAPDSEMVFAGSLRFVYGTCGDTLVIPLLGTGNRCRVDAEFAAADPSDPDTLRAAMGQTIVVPIQVRRTFGSDNVSYAGFIVRYNKTLLVPLRVDPGLLTKGEDVESALLAPGVLAVRIRSKGPTLQAGTGSLALITFRCVVGDTAGTRITLTLDSLEQKCFTAVTLLEGYFALIPPCGERTGEVLRAAGASGISQVTPNPFNPRATIEYYLAADGPAELAVYTLLGEKAALLVAGRQNAGYHRALFDAGGLPGGMYIVILRTREGIAGRKMLSVK